MAILQPEFVAVLRCPETWQRLEEVSLGVLRGLEGAEGCGLPAMTGWEAGLVREDGRVVYPVRGGMPVLLKEEGLFLAGGGD